MSDNIVLAILLILLVILNSTIMRSFLRKERESFDFDAGFKKAIWLINYNTFITMLAVQMSAWVEETIANDPLARGVPYHVARNSTVELLMKRIEEIQKLVDTNNNDELDKVCQETMRLYPVHWKWIVEGCKRASVMARKLHKDMVV